MQKDRVWHLVSKKLAGEASQAELIELEELLRQHPEMHYAIQHIQDLWKLHPLAAPEAEDAFQKHLNKMQAKGIDVSVFKPDCRQGEPAQQTGEPYPSQMPGYPAKRPAAKRFIITGMTAVKAGLVFAAITAGLIFWLNPFQNKPTRPQTVELSEISTRNGSRSRINLPDGSVVWLNAGSKLVYDKTFGGEVREVTLTGEAYFDVVKNEQKPFIIHANNIDIKVLGTLFNVKSYPGENKTEASLIHGSIEVLIRNRPANSQKVILRPNEKIIVLDEPPAAATDKKNRQAEPFVAISHLNYETRDSTYLETSWVENKLLFRDESFKDVAIKLERWYGVLIHFENESLQQLRFTGSFIRNESIHQAMAALRLTGGFNYSINDNIIRIY
ncbi:MAG TPA: FecR family protein [Chitinophagaceae bacterium]|nr:FecR family protein [Chitinophagaceae bacterium]